MRILLFFAIILFGVVAYFFGAKDLLELAHLQSKLASLQEAYNLNPLGFALAYTLGYALLTGLSIPGAALITVLAGAVMGLAWGTVVSSFGSTLGAVLSFLLSRYLLRDFVRTRFEARMTWLFSRLETEGLWALFSLRLIPVLPFFLINLLMGLTGLSVWKFAWVSQLGMLPGTFVYVAAGKSFSTLKGLDDIFSPGLLALMVFVAVTGVFVRRWRKGL